MTQAASFIRVEPKVLTGLAREPERLERVVAGDLKVGRRVDIGRAADGVHFLLSPRRRAGAVGDTGDAFGLGLFGGDDLISYALWPGRQVRSLANRAVVRIDRELQAVTGDRLHRSYDPVTMDRMGVAPGGWRQQADEGFEFLLDAFLQWRELLHLAAEHDQAVICIQAPSA